MKNIVTRFAPSPTGYLHIGGARTALFNWLLARHFGGKFLLRIEDTDRARSTKEAVDTILEGLKWLNIEWDDVPIFQFSRAHHHVELAESLVREGKAYYCYCSPEELEEMRETARVSGKSPKYSGKWRDLDTSAAPKDVKPVIRLKSPMNDETTTLHDLVQGDVSVTNNQLDDMILVRSDGTPTFMLSVVVDDHDMGITHVIRGDDHLTNTFRQMQIYEAFDWEKPSYAHIPLIHGADGAKLSKRHGAMSVGEYKEMGFLPEAMCNYLLRLGWSHGDDEIISIKQAIEWFSVKSIGKSASRFDLTKLTNVNGHYIRSGDDENLLNHLLYFSEEKLSDEKKCMLLLGMNGLKHRAKTLLELKEIASIYTDDFIPRKVTDEKDTLAKIIEILKTEQEWTEPALEITLRALSNDIEIPFNKIAQLLRNVLTGRKITPSIFDMLVSFGKEESINRLCACL